MPYRTYNQQDPWAQGASTLASALFPGPEQQIAMHGAALERRGAEQDINISRRQAELADALGDSVRNNDLREMMALSANSGHQHMGRAGDFGAALMGLPDSGFGDEEQFRMLAAAGNRMDQNSAVSMPHQSALAERDHGYGMAQEGMKERGRMARHEPGSTAWLRNKQAEAQILQQMHGLSPEDAWSTVLGHRNDRMDALGNLAIVDIAQPGGRADRIPVSGMEPDPFTIPGPPDREDLGFDPGGGTGAWAASQGVWNRTVGQALPSWTAMGPEQAAQQTNVLRLNIMSALRSTNRPLKIEMELVDSLLPSTMSFMQSPEVARQQTLQVLDLVGQQYLSDMQLASDPRIPRKEQAEYRQRANQLLRGMQLGLQPEAVDRYTGAAGAPQVPRRESAPTPGRGMQEMMQGPAEQQAPPRAVNPQTGEAVIFINGQWVPE